MLCRRGDKLCYSAVCSISIYSDMQLIAVGILKKKKCSVMMQPTKVLQTFFAVDTRNGFILCSIQVSYVHKSYISCLVCLPFTASLPAPQSDVVLRASAFTNGT